MQSHVSLQEKAEEVLRQRRGGNDMTEAKTGVMWPKARNTWTHKNQEEARNELSLESWNRAWLCLQFWLLPSDCERIYFCFGFFFFFFAIQFMTDYSSLRK